MRLGSSRASAAALIALAISSGGCALIMQQAPKKDREPREVPVCSTGRGGVVLDGIVASLLGAGALVGLANDEPGVGLGLGAIAGLYTYSAVSGHRSASKCEAAMKDYQAEMFVADDETPPALRLRHPAAPPPQPPVAATAPPPRAAGPRLEEAAPPVEEPVAEPPPAGEPAPQPVAVPAPDDWSDFWVEVRK
jgi:hypothetical protein